MSEKPTQLFKRVWARAERTDCRTGRTREVKVLLEIRSGFDGDPWLHIVYGGVTGYESMKVARAVEDLDGLKADVPWAACWGATGSWDKLDVFGRDVAAYLEEWFGSTTTAVPAG